MRDRPLAVALAIGILLLSAPLAAQVGLEDYVACWDFNEGQGTTLHDRSANGLDGQVQGAMWTAGINGGGLAFNGLYSSVNVTDGVGSPAIFNSMGEGSISVWFKFDSVTPAGQIHPILYVGDGVGGSTNSSLIVEIGHFVVDSELFFTVLDGTGLPTQCFDSGFPLQTNTWYHFVAVVGPNYNTGFLDGVEMTARNYNFGSAASSDFLQEVPNQQVCWFGRGKLGAIPADQWFHGKLDEFRIYDRPLSAFEANQLYVVAGQTYPGTVEDFVLSTGIDGAVGTTGGAANIKQVQRGNYLTVSLTSPGATFFGGPVLLAADLLPSSAIAPNPTIPGLWLRTPGFMILVDGLVPGPLGYSHVVGPGGSAFPFQIPLGLPPQSLVVQAAVAGTVALNGSYAVSEAHEIQIQ